MVFCKVKIFFEIKYISFRAIAISSNLLDKYQLYHNLKEIYKNLKTFRKSIRDFLHPIIYELKINNYSINQLNLMKLDDEYSNEPKYILINLHSQMNHN